MENKANKKPFLYFSSLELKNVKCFGEHTQTLSLKNRDGTISPWTLILGDNGIGKTTLLKCLAWMTPVEAPAINDDIISIGKSLLERGVSLEIVRQATGLSDSVFLEKELSGVQIKPYMDDFEDEEEYERFMRNGENIETSVSATFSINTELGAEPNIGDEFTLGMEFIKKEGKLDVVNANRLEVNKYIAPNIYAYSASRHMASKNIDNSALKNSLHNLFSGSGDLYDAEQLLSDLNNTSKSQEENGVVTELLNKLKRILVDLLPNLDKVEDIVINAPMNDKGNRIEHLVEIQTENGRVSLYNLSLGYQTMLSWAVDLAIRMLWDNPDSPNPLEEPAIVIIDEIDLHLHPKWQRTLRRFLTEHFVNTQFICTAHSPFMAQSAENENLCVINKIEDQVVINNEPEIVKGWRIGQIVTSDLFGIDSERSPEIEKLILERRGLLRNKKLSDTDTKRLEELDKIIIELPTLDDKSQRILEKIENMMEAIDNKEK